MRYDISKDFQKLERAGIDPRGLKIVITRSQNVEDFFIGDDTVKFEEIIITLQNHSYTDNEETVEEYGRVSGMLITTFDPVTGRKLDYMDVIDSIEQDTYNCLSVFMDENGDYDDDLMFSQFFYIDRFVISMDHRGVGLGSILLEYIQYKLVDPITAIVLQPFAFEKKEESEEVFKKESEHLCRFYEKHGFKKYRGTTWVYHES